MNMHSSQQQLIRELPDIVGDQDKTDYIVACVAFAVKQGYPQYQAVEAARIKWQSWEVTSLIDRIQHTNADNLRDLKEAVVMLLKDRYIV
jgi:hypothetical protein